MDDGNGTSFLSKPIELLDITSNIGDTEDACVEEEVTRFYMDVSSRCTREEMGG